MNKDQDKTKAQLLAALDSLRRKSKEQEDILQASNQQLYANNQQLQASEQQLRAANQQLDASNQQLIASEKELKKEKIFSEKIVETADAIIVGLDKDHIIRIFNQGAENITGYKKEEVIGKDWFKIFFPKEMLDEMNKVWENAWGVKSHSYVNPILAKSGEERIISWHNTGMYDGEDISKHLLISIGEDITERKQAEEELKKLSSMVEQSTEGMALADMDGNLTFVNPAWYKMHGYKSSKKLIGRNLSIFHNKEQLENEVLPFNEKVKKYGSHSGEVGHITSNGKSFPTFMTTTLLKDEKGNPYALAGIAKDITERKKAEEARRKSDERFRIAQDMSPDGFTILHPVRNKQDRVIDFTWVYENEAVAKLNGTDPQEVVGKRLLDLFPGHRGTQFLKAYIQVAESGESVTFEEGYSGETMKKQTWFRIVVVPMAENIAILAQDITERKQGEEKLKAKNTELQMIMESSPIMIFYADKEGKNLLANKTLAEYLGKRREEIEGKYYHELFPDELAEKMIKDNREIIESGKPKIGFEERYEAADGIRWSRTSKVPLLDNHGKIIGITGFAEDITEQKESEKEIRESERKVTTLMGNLPGMAYRCRNIPEWTMEFISEGCSELTGYNSEEIIADKAISYNKIIHPDDRKMVWETVQEAVEKNQHFEMEYRIITKDKKEKWVWERGKCVSLVNGEPEVLEGFISDITERIEAKENLYKSQQRYKKLFAESLNPMFLINPETNVIEEVNPAGLTLVGYSKEEMVGSHFTKILPEDKKETAELLKNVEEEENGLHISEKTMVTKTGQQKLINAFFTYYWYDHRDVIMVLAEDITERKKAEIKLKDREQQLATIYSSVADIIYMIDVEPKNCFRFSSVNQAFLDATGLTRDKIEGKLIGEVIPEPSLSTVRKNYLKAIREKRIVYWEETSEYPSGAKTGIVNIAPIMDENGKCIRLVGSVHDITERKESEEKLKFSEEKLKSVFSAAGDGIMIVDNKIKVLDVNTSFSKITDIPAKYVVEKSGFDLAKEFLSKQQLPGILKYLNRLMTRGSTSPLQLDFRGKTLDIRINKSKGTGYFVVTLRDVTAEERSIHIQKVIHNISNAVIKTNSLYAFIDLVRKELKAIIDTTNFYIALYDVQKGMLTMPFHRDKKDHAESFPPGKTLTAYVLKTRKSLLATRDVVKKLTIEGKIETIGAESEVWLGIPLLTKDKVVGVMAMQSYESEDAYDSSDIKMLEIISHQISISIERMKTDEDLKNALEKAQESDRLKSAFLSNMSHEIRTPMNGILGFIELLKEPQLSGDEKENYIQVIEKSGERMLNTINDIVDISQIEAGQVKVTKKAVSVNSILDEQYNFFYREARTKGLELNYKPALSDNESHIITDQHKLESILTNLIKNAIKYTKAGSVSFGCTLKTKEGKDIVEFYVKDTGIGIPADRVDAIFHRFEQADIEDTRVFEGSGLGLAISKSYVEMLGGEINVSSKEGSGSTFTLSIPYNKRNLNESGATQNKEEESGVSLKNLSVIVAEDDENSKMLFETILKNKFKKISYTSTGKETIDKCRENPDVNIILMDIKMPDMNGYYTTREIRKFNPDVIIIAQTAHGLSGDKEKALEAGCDDYIAKPIKKEILFEKIRDCLDKKCI